MILDFIAFCGMFREHIIRKKQNKLLSIKMKNERIELLKSFEYIFLDNSILLTLDTIMSHGYIPFYLNKEKSPAVVMFTYNEKLHDFKVFDKFIYSDDYAVYLKNTAPDYDRWNYDWNTCPPQKGVDLWTPIEIMNLTIKQLQAMFNQEN